MITSPGKRFFAYILDGIIDILFIIIIGLIVGLPAILNKINPDNYTIFELPKIVANSMGTIYIIISILVFLSPIIFQIFFWSRGTSMGKRVLKMYVVNKESNKPIGFWKMFLRELICKPVSGMFFGLGYIWILIDDKRQSWHDKILDTIVITK